MLPEIFGLIQCIIGCVIVFKHSQKVVWHRKWVLHPVVAPIRDQKTRQMPTKLSFWGRKNHFFFWAAPSPDPFFAPHYLDVSPPTPLLKS